MMNVIDKGREAVVSISRTVAELVATRPEGYPAGELYAAMMPLVKTLDTFEMLMGMAIRLNLVTKRGQLYRATEGT